MARTSKTAPTRRSLVAVITSASIAIAVHAETLPNPGLLDARIRIASYSPDEVYRLQGFVGYQTDLQFDTVILLVWVVVKEARQGSYT